ncbi:MAG: tRNA (adenosine(37)-N6)-threonylcarbamoyltransferase complex ATPase subunit type 1 TsaE [Chloroflexi bacterium]|nr:tRNA (adenosine(37)-N6)-threonylcarbamoyltransferase complex ATPase subunit type 1 TsaE [Chloroflexota bacterium]
MPANPSLDVISHSAGSTRRVGERLGRRLRGGDIVLLSGDLGAGKTTFAQGLAAGLGVTGPVASPTFTLINEYAGRTAGGAVTLAHIDLFRLAGADAAMLGLDDYLEATDVICVVEWPQMAPDAWPSTALIVDFIVLSDAKRRLTLRPAGPEAGRYAADLAALRKELYGAAAR